jgi:hypothetical protein
MSIEMKCDRCREAVDELYEAVFCFTEMKFGELPDGNFSDLTVHVCEKCSYALEDLLAKECHREPLKREQPKENDL